MRLVSGNPLAYLPVILMGLCGLTKGSEESLSTSNLDALKSLMATTPTTPDLAIKMVNQIVLFEKRDLGRYNSSYHASMTGCLPRNVESCLTTVILYQFLRSNVILVCTGIYSMIEVSIFNEVRLKNLLVDGRSNK